MSNINKRLNELSPHVLGIRFTNNISVVDTFFKEGWSLPESDVVGFEAVPARDNIYMLYPHNESVGVDEMLDYVGYVIKVNIEREQKIELLQSKINELKSIFTKSSLAKCKTLIFKFSDLLESKEEVHENIDLPIMTEPTSDVSEVEPDKIDSVITEESITEESIADVPIADIPKNTKEVNRFNNTAKVNNETFDLPPRGTKVFLEEFNEPDVICKCDPNDPNQACPVCIGY
jgi:hypothetical protein|tara:strand:- start:483 stop:1178 length:696 start_codon:yes stop_codon:yes gene_type:complete